MRRYATVTGIIGMLLVLPTAAWAHPFVRGEVPVDSAATLTLDLAHGCTPADGTHGDGDEEATREIGVRFPPEVDVRTVVEADGFTVEAPVQTDGYDEWTLVADADTDVLAPVVMFAVVVNADPTDTLWLAVYQGCTSTAHRWVATPENPDGEPGVSVRLAAADPAAPAAGAPERDVFADDAATGANGTNGATDEATGDDGSNEDAEIDFIGVDLPQTTDAWIWYVLGAGVLGVLLAKRAGGGNQKR